jgi:probable HAF family extracellular repeat protein
MMQDLGTLPGGTLSEATGINNAGQVVGDSYAASRPVHAFLYSGGQMQDLGTLGGQSSAAVGINNAGQVIGGFETASGGFDSFLYSGGTMIDLNTAIDPASGWKLCDVDSINDMGQIVGYGVNSDGQLDSLMLTPIAAGVPEPAALTLLTLGGLAMLRRKK